MDINIAQGRIDYILSNYDCYDSGKGIIEINDVTRTEFGKFINEFKYKRGVEVGVYKGYFSEEIMKASPFFEMYGVDPYVEYPGKLKGSPKDWEAEAKRRLEHRFLAYHFVKKPSIEAVKDFEDDSLDFVYIDGDHEFAQVALDLSSWHRKVRSGGIVAGHDYYLPTGKDFFHVKQAVDAFTYAYDIRPLFIMGREGGEYKRDKIRSWFYFKQ